MTRILLSLTLLGLALALPAASEAKSCQITSDAPIADLRAKNISCKAANKIAAKYQANCMGAPCKVRYDGVKYSCEAGNRTVCKKGDRKATWMFAGGDHG